MKKVLIVGDYENGPYHPLSGVDEVIKGAIGDQHEVTCTEDYDAMCDVTAYDLLISYTDCWRPEDTVSAAQAAGVISYVANGGKLLVLHGGISLQKRCELIPVMGAKFVSHPKMAEMTVHMLDEEDPITKGVQDFVTVEEPYQYAFDPFSEITHLAEYQIDGKTYPHSWKKSYCKGEVVYLMGGHTAAIIAEEGNATLIKNAVAYLLQ